MGTSEDPVVHTDKRQIGTLVTTDLGLGSTALQCSAIASRVHTNKREEPPRKIFAVVAMGPRSYCITLIVIESTHKLTHVSVSR